MKRLMALTFGVALTGCTALSGRLPCQDDADCPQRVPSCSVAERVCTDAPQPDAPQPDAPAPDVADPDVSEPDVFEPDVADPDVSEPDVFEPDVAEPDAGLSEAGVIVDGGAPLSDAGPVEDAGVIDDAGHIDDGGVVDGGVVDGGHVDAGSPANAGTGSQPPPPAVAQLAGSTMGGTFCRLLVDGQLECWGAPHQDISRPPLGAYVEVAVATNAAYPDDFGALYRPFGCALRTADRTPRCWGRDVVPPVVAVHDMVAVSDFRNTAMCALRVDDDVPVCWGDGVGQVAVPQEALTSVGLAVHYACGTRSDGSLLCWGNLSGVDVPDDVFVPGTFTSHAHSNTLCAERAAGGVACFGTHDAPWPAPLDPGLIGVELHGVVFGYEHGCGLDDDGFAWCWSQHGTGTNDPLRVFPVDRAAQPPVGVAFSSLAPSYDSICGLRVDDEQVMCWGGMVAGHGEADSARPAVHISLSTHASCFVDDTGHAGCWAERYVSNQTIVGTEAAPPVDVVFDTIDMAQQFGCGIRSQDGQVECWGNGSFVVDNVPTDGPFVDVAVAHSMACAARADGSVECWGPTAATQPDDLSVQLLKGGITGVCGLRDDDTAVCWGSGDGIAAAPTTTFSTLAVGNDLVCGVRKSDGLLECWGGSEAYPSFVPEDVAFATLDLSHSHGCGVGVDEVVTCWGQPGADELQPPADFAATDVAVGDSVTCALRKGGGHACWGRFQRGLHQPAEADATIVHVDEHSVEQRTLRWTLRDGADRFVLQRAPIVDDVVGAYADVYAGAAQTFVDDTFDQMTGTSYRVQACVADDCVPSAAVSVDAVALLRDAGDGSNVTDVRLVDDDRLVVIADWEEPGVPELYTVYDDGRAPTLLTAGHIAGRGLLSIVGIDAAQSHVLYVANRVHSAVVELFQVPVDGSGPPTPLVSDSPYYVDPGYVELTPDGARVVFIAHPADQTHAVLSSVPVTLAPGAVAVQLSPTNAAGHVTDFFLDDENQQVFFLGDVRTAGQHELMVAPVDQPELSAPAFGLPDAEADVRTDVLLSPDGTYIGLRADLGDDDVVHAYVLPTDLSSGPLQVSDTDLPDGAVATLVGFTPDNASLVYIGDLDEDGFEDLYVGGLDGGQHRVVLPGATGAIVNFSARVSPDGGHVVYLAGTDAHGNDGIFLADTDGTAPARYVQAEGHHDRAATSGLSLQFSADSRHILFESGVGNGFALFSGLVDDDAPAVRLSPPTSSFPFSGVVGKTLLSPDQQTVFFVWVGDENDWDAVEFRTVPIDGRIPSVPLQPGRSHMIDTGMTDPVFSPDGRTVVMSGDGLDLEAPPRLLQVRVLPATP